MPLSAITSDEQASVIAAEFGLKDAARVRSIKGKYKEESRRAYASILQDISSENEALCRIHEQL